MMCRVAGVYDRLAQFWPKWTKYEAMTFWLFVTEAIGVVGALTIVGAYFWVSSGRVDGTNPAFNLINLAGAGMILFSLAFRPNTGAIVLEIIWVIVAAAALVNWWRNRTDKRSND